MERKPVLVDLALQGGGSHGAFTWGVLDRLLESGDVDIDTVSGTSAAAPLSGVRQVPLAPQVLGLDAQRFQHDEIHISGLLSRLAIFSATHAGHARLNLALWHELRDFLESFAWIGKTGSPAKRVNTRSSFAARLIHSVPKR